MGRIGTEVAATANGGCEGGGGGGGGGGVDDNGGDVGDDGAKVQQIAYHKFIPQSSCELVKVIVVVPTGGTALSIEAPSVIPSIALPNMFHSPALQKT